MRFFRAPSPQQSIKFVSLSLALSVYLVISARVASFGGVLCVCGVWLVVPGCGRVCEFSCLVFFCFSLLCVG